jgi:hypothetical protein
MLNHRFFCFQRLRKSDVCVYVEPSAAASAAALAAVGATIAAIAAAAKIAISIATPLL